MGWGDEVMATGQARVMQEVDPRPVAVVDAAGRQRWHAAWQNNPRIARPGYIGPRQTLLNASGARPYIAGKTDQRWTWREWERPHGEIYLSAAENDFGRRYAGRIILEPNLKPYASPNKDWGWVRWEKLAWILQARLGLRVTQVGPIETPLLLGADLVVTRDYRDACAVLAHAKAAVLPEGGLHHAAAALGVPAVVIFGGYISPAHTGYDGHVNLFTGGTACGMRTRCTHCAEAMAKISPESVADQLKGLIDEANRRRVAA